MKTNATIGRAAAADAAAVRTLPMAAGYDAAVRDHIIDMLEETASRLGLPRTRLDTNRRFTSNLALYSRLGYLGDKTESFATGQVISMSKPL